MHKSSCFPRALLFLALLGSPAGLEAADLTEANASAWAAFASDHAAVQLSDDTTHVRAGGFSLRFDTASGFDTGVKYPGNAGAHWNLATNTHLIFWSFGVNTNVYQGNQPVIVLRSATGSFSYEPDHLVTANGQWTLVKVPLVGDAHWTRTVSGSPTLTNVTQLEIHQDTWDSGFTMFYDGVQFVTLGTNSPPPGPAAPPGINPDAVVQRVLLFSYDPVMENKGGLRMHEVYNWTDPLELTQGILHDFNSNSHSLYLPQIVETQIVDEYPLLQDGFRYDDITYDQAVQSGNWHNSGFDYWRFMLDHNLVSRVERGDLDEIWIYSSPGAGLWESTMAGQGGYWCNSGPVPGATNQHLVIIMGWNFERGVAEAIHSFGHRAESIMAKIYDNQWLPSRTNAWSAFSLLDKDAPDLGGIGNVHYPVNGLSDYDYANTNFVWSACDAWPNYPDLTNAARQINFHEWSPAGVDPQREYLNWWYAHFPRRSGKAPAPDDRLNNWWRYLIDVDQFKNGDGTLTSASGIGSVQITSPTNGTSVGGMTSVSVDASLDGIIGRVDLYVDGAFYSSDSLAPFVSAWDTDGLLGLHTLTAKAYELQAGSETVSAPVTVTVRGASVTGLVLSNTAPISGAVITASGSVKRWLRQSSAPSVPIPDNNPAGVTNVITITQTGTVSTVQVGVTIRHPNRSHLRLSLVHPSGVTVRLAAEGGNAEPDLMTFYPDLTAPLESLDTLVGLPVAGSWKLIVADVTAGITGQIETWSLALNYREPQTFVATTDLNGSYSLTNLPAGDYEFRPTKPGVTFLPILTNLSLSANTATASFLVGSNAAPFITAPPQSQTVIAGTDVTLAVVAGGTAPLTYQWYYNSIAIPGATSTTLTLSNVVVGASGSYRIVVSNPIPASAAATATLTVLPTPFPNDLCETNAAAWDSFVPPWENATSSVSDDTTHTKVGTHSIRFDTTSGFDTGIKFPKGATAHWDLRTVGWLSFWAFSDNNTPSGFQGPQPVLVLDSATGSATLTPHDQLMVNHAWAFFRIPLLGNPSWTLTTDGVPNWSDVNQLELHQDTWDSGFTIYYDGLQFEPRPILSVPQWLTNGLPHIFVSAPVGVVCTLQSSTNLAQWTDIASRMTTQPLEEWFPGPGPASRFFRILAQ